MNFLLSESSILFIISSASGVGKSTICRTIIELDDTISLAISYTTRIRRDIEIDCVDYFFVDETLFLKMIDDGEFLEYESVFGNFYGTPKNQLRDNVSIDKDMLFDIDYNGMKKLKALFPNNIVSIFILPPSFYELEKRITIRNQNTVHDRNIRLNQAKKDLKHWKSYDYIVINDNFKKAIDDIFCIINAERLKKTRSYTKINNMINLIVK